MPSDSSRAPRRPGSPQTFPPIVYGQEAVQGAVVLEEIPGTLGLSLWKTLRDVMLWARTRANRRQGLFPPGSEQRRRVEAAIARPDHELRDPLLRLILLTRNAAPENPREITEGCRIVAEWAARQGAPGTHLAFLQAAALVTDDAGLSFAVARLVRNQGDFTRAETWYRRTIKLGRGRDWKHYTLAHLGLGNAYLRLGELPAAHALATRALKAARRHKLRSLGGLALHDLFVIAARQWDAAAAHRYAKAALQAYGLQHPRVAILAHDVAGFWALQMQFARASPVFEAMLPRITDPVERGCVLANLAQCAAGVGDRARYERYRIEAAQLVATLPTALASVEILLGLAQAAVYVDDWEHAEVAARRALDVSEWNGWAEARQQAEQQLTAIRERTPLPCPKTEETPSAAREADQLARDLVLSLQATTAGT